MSIRPKALRKWHIRNWMSNFWQPGKGGWGLWSSRRIFTEEEKRNFTLPQGGTWQTED